MISKSIAQVNNKHFFNLILINSFRFRQFCFFLTKLNLNKILNSSGNIESTKKQTTFGNARARRMWYLFQESYMLKLIDD